MDTKLNWGILATGGIARKFAAGLQQSHTSRLVAVGSRTPGAAQSFAADFPGVRAHGSYDALLGDPEVAVVYIATPHPSHLEWAVRAAESGKHILCEKPLAMNAAETRRMIAAARAHRVFLMEAFIYRCHAQTDRLAELVASGTLGELRAISSTFTVNFKFDPAHRIFNKALGGGGILDLGCYPVSFVRRMAGAALGKPFAEPLSLHGAGRLNAITGADEFATASLAFPGGITAQISCGTCVPLAVGARLLFTGGWIDVPSPFHPGHPEMPGNVIVHRTGSAPEVLSLPETRSFYTVEADTVAEAIARGELEAAVMTHADSLGNMAVLDTWRAAIGMRYEGE
jgi:predicted dehydrogenase